MFLRHLYFAQAPAIIVLLILAGCGSPESTLEIASAPPFRAEKALFATLNGTPLAKRSPQVDSPRFALLSPDSTGVSYVNVFQSDHPRKDLYSSGFSCGGVAIGDVDGDGWPDLFFTGGPTRNKLFRNLGGFQFEYITQKSGIARGRNPWSAGAAFADMDGDGDLDLYVCNHETANQLWVNDGKGKFIEQAKKFGVDAVSSSLMPYFQDYDGDGDLDFFLLTNRLFRPGGHPEKPPTRKRKDGGIEISPEYRKYFALKLVEGKLFMVKVAGLRNHLYRNDGDRFAEVSKEAGLTESGQGLSAVWWDFDEDGDPDLYVANDHSDPDHLYRNDGGHFVDIVREMVPHVTWFSMGSDVADLDGDGREDLFTLDMSGTDHFKQKTTMGVMSNFRWFLENANPRQYMRNALLLNEGMGRFREAAYLAGLADSDWGWAVKIEDFDEDGTPDVFVTNGMTRNYTDSDKPMAQGDYIGRSEFDFNLHSDFKKDINQAYRNEGNLRFSNLARDWGLNHNGMSFAAAHGDLDRDGDLDLVVANLNEPAFLYRNDSHEGNRILLKLKGSNSIGAKVTVTTAERRQVKTLRPMTGYMSCDESVLHFGLGKEEVIATLEVRWPNGAQERYENVPANYYLEATPPKDTKPSSVPPAQPTYFTEIEVITGPLHEEKSVNDYQLQPLLPHRLSRWGPGMAWADLDGNGRPDLYLGGSAGQAGAIWLNEGKGKFRPLAQSAFEQDKSAEDLGALFFDADGDGDQDLFVSSGSHEYANSSEHYRDRLYRNEGNLRFTSAPLPDHRGSSGSASAADFDRDGDLDLFVGGRLRPGEYPLPGKSRLLRNDDGNFTEVIGQVAPGLADAGMVTGSLWTDVDADGWPDLLLSTEWGPVKLFRNRQGSLVDETQAAGLAELKGWWTGLAAADCDSDGDLDYVVGNLGLNTKYKVTKGKPYLAYYGSFDSTGRKRFVEATYEHEKLFPVRGKSCSSEAMPFVANKFKSYVAFAKATLPEIYTQQCLDDSYRVEANLLESGILLNDGQGRFTFKALPRIAQIAPIFGVAAEDFDADGNVDLVLAQNFYWPQPETGRMAGGLGQYLRGNGDGSFEPIRPKQSGIAVPDDARSLVAADIDADGRLDLAFGLNDGPVTFFSRNDNKTSSERYLRVKLTGKNGNPTAIGALLTLTFSDGSTLIREIHAGQGYLSQSTPDAWFGLGDKNPQTIEVRWPDGQTSSAKVETGQSNVVLTAP